MKLVDFGFSEVCLWVFKKSFYFPEKVSIISHKSYLSLKWQREQTALDFMVLEDIAKSLHIFGTSEYRFRSLRCL